MWVWQAHFELHSIEGNKINEQSAPIGDSQLTVLCTNYLLLADCKQVRANYNLRNNLIRYDIVLTNWHVLLAFYCLFTYMGKIMLYYTLVK